MAPPSYIAAEIADMVDRELPVDEFIRRISTPPSAEEIEEVRRLRAWFTRRYPTVTERMRYVTRAYRAWTRPLLDRGARDAEP